MRARCRKQRGAGAEREVAERGTELPEIGLSTPRSGFFAVHAASTLRSHALYVTVTMCVTMFLCRRVYVTPAATGDLQAAFTIRSLTEKEMINAENTNVKFDYHFFI